MNIRTSILSLIITLIAFALPENVTGQTMKVEGQVFVNDGKNDIPSKRQYIIVKSSRAKKIVDKVKSFGSGPMAVTEIEKYFKNEEIVLTSTENDGRFEEYVMPGSSFVFFDGLFNTQIESAENINRTNKILFKTSGKVLKEFVKTGAKKRSTTKITPAIDTDYGVVIRLYAYFEKGYSKKNARLTIQPCLVDCSNEDTLHYLDPLVFDAKTYHTIQNKRMDYDFEANDSIAKFFKGEQSNFGFTPDSILVDTTVIYIKSKEERRSKKNLKGCYFVVLDDFTHEYYNNHGAGTGSCYRKRPLKFVDFSMAMVDLPLSDEFKEIPKQNHETVPRDLRLKFEVNTATLTKDSTNNVELQKMVEELRSYGERLWGIKVEGGASPEGNLTRNTTLATQRAQVAKSLILQHVRGILSSQDITVLSPKVYTWEDTAKELDKLGFKTEADTVRHFIKTLGEKGNINLTLKRVLPNYDATIKVALENLRIMKCSYTYETQKILTPEEAADKYYNDPQYKDGRKHFSDGDLFNLFKIVKDSAELEKLIPYAYKEVTRYPGYEKKKFAPFVAVKMANLQQKRGVVNTEILRPFISDITPDERDSTINITVDEKVYFDNVDDGYWIRNRRVILINQAIMYFKSMALDTAQAIIDIIPNDPDIRNLKHFVNFRTLYFDPNKENNPEMKALADSAYNFIINTSLENNAIIHVELRDELDTNWNVAYNLVDQMKDSDPRKWYLLGMLHADKEYVENERELIYDESANLKRLDELITGNETSEQELLEKLTSDNFKQYRLLTMDEESIFDTNPKLLAFYTSLSDKYNQLEAEWLEQTGGVKKKENKTKQFLAYFQHSFDLAPNYKLLYFEEGNIDEDVRKKYRYKRQEIPDYRDKFETIMKAREYERKNGVKSNDEELPVQEDDSHTTE